MDELVLIERAKAFVDAVASNAAWAEIEAFYDPGVVQEEFPNRLASNAATRDLGQLRDANAKGRQVLRSQTMEIVNAWLWVNASSLRRSGWGRLPSASAR